MGFNCLKVAEPLQRDFLLSSPQEFLVVSFIDLERSLIALEQLNYNM